MRLLRALDLKPRRTIRAALWGAEESGLLGSRGYVREHFGDPESPEKPAAHANLSVYFNVDWYGRFRGIYLQGNDRARPIFEAWMAPFHDVGMSWIVPGNTCCTDHMAFLETGLQGFQFIQDDLEFFNTTFGRRVGLTPAQFAILWSKDQPGIMAPLIGPRTLRHLEDLLPVLEMSLTCEQRAACDALVPPGSVVADFHNTADWMKMTVLPPAGS